MNVVIDECALHECQRRLSDGRGQLALRGINWFGNAQSKGLKLLCKY